MTDISKHNEQSRSKEEKTQGKAQGWIEQEKKPKTNSSGIESEEKVMRPGKEELEIRKKELQKQFDDLSEKIRQGRDAIRNMETTLIGLQGAIQQCNWTIELYKEEKKK